MIWNDAFWSEFQLNTRKIELNWNLTRIEVEQNYNLNRIEERNEQELK